jgi:hypothetical protein
MCISNPGLHRTLQKLSHLQGSCITVLIELEIGLEPTTY